MVSAGATPAVAAEGSGEVSAGAATFSAGAGLAKRAPHPYAAVLFLDFLLSDGQKILVDHDNVSTNTKNAGAANRSASMRSSTPP